jgi:mannose-6-phosphate isomerase-like protein (cupin superfamily)
MLENSFWTFALKNGCLAESCDELFPTSLHSWQQKSLKISADGTHFGFVFSGEAILQTKFGNFTLREKMYFCVPDAFLIEGGEGIIVTRNDYKGMFGIGGAIEENGRLRYIDGCRDTLLIPPLLKGDPCLNALYFPPKITQTSHTHPSVRVGIVAKGSGECVTPRGKFSLRAGSAFVIAPEALHSFNTYDQEMIVIAYHPDSDFGATHEDHPMINRTIVEGVSAAVLEDIRTKKD